MLVLNKIFRIKTETTGSARKTRSAGVALFLAIFLLLPFAADAMGQSATTLAAPKTPFPAGTFPPRSWIDADTGHRVTRVSFMPNSKALFSSANAFTPDGKDMIYVVPGAIFDLNLATLTSKLVKLGKIDQIIVGTKTRRVFFTKAGNISLYAVDIDTKKVTRLPGIIPIRGVIWSINADETLLVGTAIEGASPSTAPSFSEFMSKALQEELAQIKANPTAPPPSHDDIKLNAMKMRLEAHIPEDLFTINLQTGQVNVILRGTDWLNRPQFSPTDPNLIMYAHEGHSTDVDRIWTIRADGTQNQLIHQRSQKEESASREFWSGDGKTIWYELQRPKGKDFELVSYEVATGKRKFFHLDNMQSSMYYNVASDGSFFCGSGRRSQTVHKADPTVGQIQRSREWIEALYPIPNSAVSGESPQNAKWFHYFNSTAASDPNVKYTGWFRRERLVNLYKNDYTKVEPNVRISPDNKLVIFTSDMFGPAFIFAVNVN